MPRLAAALLLIAGYALAQAPAESDLVKAIAAEADPAHQLAALDKWKASYPATEFLDNRQNLYLNTYVTLKQPRQAFDTAQEILKTRPDNLAALMQTVAQVADIKPAPTTSDFEAAERAAKRLVNGRDLKPTEVTDGQWEPIRLYAQQVLTNVQQALRNDPPLQVRLSEPTPVSLRGPAPPQEVEAQYTDEARLAGLEGSVHITGSIGGDGLLHDPRVALPLGLGLDEQAIVAASQWRFDPNQSGTTTFPVDFTLPGKHSRWHLVAVKFRTPQGASRPTFAAADYPVGPGIGLAAYEEAEILSVIGRAASATVSFDIDQQGYPGNFLVEDASAEAWGPEAVRLVQRWRFHPGMKAGAPVSVPCTLSLIWGPEDFNSGAISGQLAQIFGLRANPQITATRQTERPGPPVIFKTDPEYTEEARRGGLEGTVWISVIVDEQGTPTKMNLDGPFLDSGLTQNSLDAVKQWRFQPTMLNGQPTAVQVEVQVDFKLAGVQSSVFARPPVAKTVPMPKK